MCHRRHYWQQGKHKRHKQQRKSNLRPPKTQFGDDAPIEDEHDERGRVEGDGDREDAQVGVVDEGHRAVAVGHGLVPEDDGRAPHEEGRGPHEDDDVGGRVFPVRPLTVFYRLRDGEVSGGGGKNGLKSGL